MIRIVVAEDHQSLIDGIKLSLSFEDSIIIVGEANNGEKLIELAREKQPNIVITDIRMPKCDGITATRIIKSEFPEIKIIAFSMFDQPEAIEQMKNAGADGYILKNVSLNKLIEAIKTVAEGKTFFDENLVLEEKNIEDEIPLSSREKEILKLIGEGKTSQEIAEILSIEKSTVDSHRKNILRKINIQGKTDLIRFAIEKKYDF